MADELEDLRQHVGNSQTADDVITASQAGRLAVALGVDHPAPGKGDAIPPGWHGVFFPPLVPWTGCAPTASPPAAASRHRCRCRGGGWSRSAAPIMTRSGSATR